MKSKHEDRKHVCEHCGASFETSKGLKGHIKSRVLYELFEYKPRAGDSVTLVRIQVGYRLPIVYRLGIAHSH